MKGLVGNVQLVAGGPEMRPAIFAYLPTIGIETHANPDFFYQSYNNYGIEESRELRSRATLRAVGKRRVFVIEAATITTEAQNALLKTLEEPVADVLFIFVIPSPFSLLPTLRSRAQILNLGQVSKSEEVIDTKQFLSATPQKRLDLLKPLLEKGDDDKRDMGAIITFLSALERGCRKSPEGLHAIYRARKYIADKGALVKPLLEQVALLVPKV
jgi:DNA polymerase III delta prime subunit